jgi:hypothetical protein
MRATEAYTRSTLSTSTIKRMIDRAANQGVRSISFTGGEPLLDISRLTDLICHAGIAGIPYIRTGTNGFVFRHPERLDFESRVSRLADRLAATPLRNFWISLDSSVDVVHEEMRGFSGAVAGIAKALPVFHRAGIYPAVNLGINRNVGGDTTRNLTRTTARSDDAYLERFYHRYRYAFERFYQRAIDLGFTMANTCYPMSIDTPESDQGLSAVYAATTAEDIVRFTSREKQMLFKALIAAVRRFRQNIRIFSPICSLESLVRQYSDGDNRRSAYGCRGGVDFFFINAADGHTYPCGYRGNDDYGDLEAIDIQSIKPPAEADACRQCDWECFRDPSELLGPMLEFFSNPFVLFRRLATQPRFLATWAEDLNYYRACDLFDGRQPPNYRKLRRFTSTTVEAKKKALSTVKHQRFNQKLSVS